MEDFPKILAKHLEKHGGSAREFCRESDTKPATLSLVLNGTRTPPVETLQAWAATLGLTGGELDEFLMAGLRTKARAHAEALPYLDLLEERLLEAEKQLKAQATLLRKIAEQASKAGIEIPKALRDAL
jgi:transcriptional regulator with XRE-family HTH domain